MRAPALQAPTRAPPPQRRIATRSSRRVLRVPPPLALRQQPLAAAAAAPPPEPPLLRRSPAALLPLGCGRSCWLQACPQTTTPPRSTATGPACAPPQRRGRRLEGIRALGRPQPCQRAPPRLRQERRGSRRRLQSASPSDRRPHRTLRCPQWRSGRMPGQGPLLTRAPQWQRPQLHPLRSSMRHRRAAQSSRPPPPHAALRQRRAAPAPQLARQAATALPPPAACPRQSRRRRQPLRQRGQRAVPPLLRLALRHASAAPTPRAPFAHRWVRSLGPAQTAPGHRLSAQSHRPPRRTLPAIRR
jgi:hypothetical protein